MSLDGKETADKIAQTGKQVVNRNVPHVDLRVPASRIPSCFKDSCTGIIFFNGIPPPGIDSKPREI